MIGSRERRARARRQYVRASYYAGHQMRRMGRRMMRFAEYVECRACEGRAVDLSAVRHGFVRLGCWA